MANNRQQPLVFDSTKVAADVTYMPTLITRDNLDNEVVDPSGSDAARTDGGDIRIYFSDDQTDEMAREIVSFEHDSVSDADDAEIEIWTSQTDFVNSSVSDTTIYIEYGDGALTDYATSDTFGAENVWSAYEVVYHMNQDPSGSAPQMVDSTGNGGELTSEGSMTSGDLVSSQIGDGIDFDGSNDYMSSPSGTLDNIGTGDFTLTHWYNSASDGTEVVTSFEGNWIAISASGFIASSNVGASSAAGGLNDSTNRLLGVARSGTDVDTVLNGVVNNTATNSSSHTGELRLCGLSSGSFAAEIVLDEYRIRNSYLTEDWQTTEYNNQNNPSTFATAGTPVEIGGGGVSIPVIMNQLRNQGIS